MGTSIRFENMTPTAQSEFLSAARSRHPAVDREGPAFALNVRRWRPGWGCGRCGWGYPLEVYSLPTRSPYALIVVKLVGSTSNPGRYRGDSHVRPHPEQGQRDVITESTTSPGDHRPSTHPFQRRSEPDVAQDQPKNNLARNTLHGATQAFE
jgi:hypothetical protein